jgi:hypothetical protein
LIAVLTSVSPEPAVKDALIVSDCPTGMVLADAEMLMVGVDLDAAAAASWFADVNAPTPMSILSDTRAAASCVRIFCMVIIYIMEAVYCKQMHPRRSLRAYGAPSSGVRPIAGRLGIFAPFPWGCGAPVPTLATGATGAPATGDVAL